MIPREFKRRHLAARHSERTARRALAETKDKVVFLYGLLKTQGLSRLQIGVLLGATRVVSTGFGKNRIYAARLDRKLMEVKNVLAGFSKSEKLNIVHRVKALKVFQERNIRLAEKRLSAWRKKRKELFNQIQLYRRKKRYEGD